MLMKSRSRHNSTKKGFMIFFYRDVTTFYQATLTPLFSVTQHNKKRCDPPTLYTLRSFPECQGIPCLRQVKKLNLRDFNETRTHNHRFYKQILNYLAKSEKLANSAKCLSVRFQSKWLQVRVLLLFYILKWWLQKRFF